jgi:hypothetical protein
MRSDVTVVVPTSPLPRHPDTGILEETIASVRYHFPDAEIILTFDGPSVDNVHRHDDYQEYIRRALWRARSWGAVCPFVFTEHRHQSLMMKGVMGEIRTPLILYVEHDAPLVCDEPIRWDLAVGLLGSGEANLVRFHHESLILPEHQHMAHGSLGLGEGIAAVRTSQWSQRPHLATTAFYDRILTSYFPWGDRTFIEDRMHGIVDEAYRRYGMAGWEQFRLYIYAPEGGNIKRSWHLDGRKSL